MASFISPLVCLIVVTIITNAQVVNFNGTTVTIHTEKKALIEAQDICKNEGRWMYATYSARLSIFASQFGLEEFWADCRNLDDNTEDDKCLLFVVKGGGEYELQLKNCKAELPFICSEEYRCNMSPELDKEEVINDDIDRLKRKKRAAEDIFLRFG